MPTLIAHCFILLRIVYAYPVLISSLYMSRTTFAIARVWTRGLSTHALPYVGVFSALQSLARKGGPQPHVLMSIAERC